MYYNGYYILTNPFTVILRVSCAFILLILSAGCLNPKKCSRLHQEDARIEAVAKKESTSSYENHFLEFSNFDVSWEISDGAISPRLESRLANIAQTVFEDQAHRQLHISELLDILRDKDRYILAHVLLTQCAGKPYTADAQSWNQLKFETSAGATLSPQENQQDAILKKWTKECTYADVD